MKTRLAGAPAALLLAGLLSVAGCGGGDDQSTVDTTGTAASTDMTAAQAAVVNLEPVGDSNVRGTVRFTQLGQAVQVEANLSGLAPGEHGFHIHENGDCSATDLNNDGTADPAEGAGGHFNPTGHPHGAPDAPQGQRHVGDFGNIQAGADSVSVFTRTDSLLAFSGANSIVGKALVVHADPDDLQTQPSGNAGPRVACGVIEMEGAMGMSPMGDTTVAQ